MTDTFRLLRLLFVDVLQDTLGCPAPQWFQLEYAGTDGTKHVVSALAPTLTTTTCQLSSHAALQLDNRQEPSLDHPRHTITQPGHGTVVLPSSIAAQPDHSDHPDQPSCNNVDVTSTHNGIDFAFETDVSPSQRPPEYTSSSDVDIMTLAEQSSERPSSPSQSSTPFPLLSRPSWLGPPPATTLVVQRGPYAARRASCWRDSNTALAPHHVLDTTDDAHPPEQTPSMTAAACKEQRRRARKRRRQKRLERLAAAANTHDDSDESFVMTSSRRNTFIEDEVDDAWRPKKAKQRSKPQLCPSPPSPMNDQDSIAPAAQSLRT